MSFFQDSSYCKRALQVRPAATYNSNNSQPKRWREKTSEMLHFTPCKVRFSLAPWFLYKYLCLEYWSYRSPRSVLGASVKSDVRLKHDVHKYSMGRWGKLYILLGQLQLWTCEPRVFKNSHFLFPCLARPLIILTKMKPIVLLHAICLWFARVTQVWLMFWVQGFHWWSNLTPPGHYFHTKFFTSCKCVRLVSFFLCLVCCHSYSTSTYWCNNKEHVTFLSLCQSTIFITKAVQKIITGSF